MLSTIVSVANSYYGKLFILDMGIQWVGWLFAITFKTEKFYDITGNLRKELLAVIVLSFLRFRVSDVHHFDILELPVKWKELAPDCTN